MRRLDGSPIWSRFLIGYAGFLTTRSPGAARAALVAALLTVAFLVGAVLAIAPPAQTYMVHDVSTWLDGAWKVLHGLRPHVDFYSPLGPLNYLLPAAAMRLVGLNVRALYVGDLLLAVPCLLAAWVVIRPRLAPLHAYLLLSFAALEMLRLHHPGLPCTWIVYTVSYNKLGNGLMIVLMVVLFLPRYEPSRRGDAIDGLVAGIFLGLMAFMKISYAGVAAPMLAWSYATSARRNLALRLTCLLLGFAVVALPLLFYLHFDVLSILRDFSLAYRARLDGFGTSRLLARRLAVIAPECVLLLTFLAWAFRPRFSRRTLSVLVMVGIVWTVQTLLDATTSHGLYSDLSIALAATILPMEATARAVGQAAAASPVLRRRRALSYLLASALAAGMACSGGLSVLSFVVACRHRGGVPPVRRFESPTLASLVVKAPDGEPAGSSYLFRYVEKINDGLGLLKRETSDSTRVAVFDYTNPFPFGLLRPPSCSPTTWHFHITVGREAYPEPGRALGDADAVMVPKEPEILATTDFLQEVYGGYLAEKFERKAQSVHWILYTRKWRFTK